MDHLNHFFVAIYSLVTLGHSSAAGEVVHSLEWSYGDEVLFSLGRLHYIVLHFPIALTVMTVVAEMLWLLFKNSLFDHAARFMIVCAALFAIPTVIFGFILSYTHHFQGMELSLFEWHRLFGLTTAGLLIGAAILRERHGQKPEKTLYPYYFVLTCAFIGINLTGSLGGALTFGLE